MHCLSWLVLVNLFWLLLLYPALTAENGLFDARERDLTLIAVIDLRVDLSLSQGRGYGVDFCSV